MEVEPESLSSWSDGFEKWSCFFLFFSFLFFCCWDILKHLLKKKCYYDFYVSNVLNKIHGINYSISSPPFPKSEFPFLRIYPRLSFFFFFFSYLQVCLSSPSYCVLVNLPLIRSGTEAFCSFCILVIVISNHQPGFPIYIIQFDLYPSPCYWHLCLPPVLKNMSKSFLSKFQKAKKMFWQKKK